MIVLIDNYDSFTWNVYQLLSSLGADTCVVRNDELTVDSLASLCPSGIVVSPGPGDPGSAGVSCAAIRWAAGRLPVLGICLGHQCIGHAFGARIGRAPELMHGKTSLVRHDGSGVFEGLPTPFEAVRYHSLCVERDSLPSCLEVTAETYSGTIMGLRHRELPIEGVQFHPESVLTRDGPQLVGNFLARIGESGARLSYS